jgi:flagella basal body P-ring formation protein FlgA
MRIAIFAAALLAAGTPAIAQSAADMVDAPVLARTVEKGERLAQGDFVVKPIPAAAARKAMSPSEVMGKETSRRLLTGTSVRTGDLLVPQIVKRGDAVLIAVRTGQLSITTPGRALSGGGAGDLIRVLNVDTNRTLNAVVEESGHVRVTIS